MTAAPGFHVSLAAGEPDVVQPFAFCFDDRGRIWLAENQNYATRGSHISEPAGRIIILEDTDGDGRFEDRKVFIENLFFPTGLEIGFGGVWVGSPPNLLFIPDREAMAQLWSRCREIRKRPISLVTVMAELIERRGLTGCSC